jgi:uncharacterized protein YwgA
MIVSEQMTREEAQKEYELPLYDEKDMENTINKVLNKLNMTKEEFSKIMMEPARQHQDYPTSLYIKTRSYIYKIYKKINKYRTI